MRWLRRLLGAESGLREEPAPVEVPRCRHGLIHVGLYVCDVCNTVVVTPWTTDEEMIARALRVALRGYEDRAGRIVAATDDRQQEG